MDSDGAGSPGGRPQVDGVVTETLPSALYKVRLAEGSVVVAHIADRMDRNFVRILVGDRVRLEISPSDIGRGRIVGKIA
jgi:translation initiation factor IF-1